LSAPSGIVSPTCQVGTVYGHLLPDAIERGRAALEAFDARSYEAFGQLSGNAD
jgi:hypothetical protein